MTNTKTLNVDNKADNKVDTKVEANRALAIRLMEAISNNDLPTLTALIHPDVVSHGITDRRGIEEYKAFFAMMHASISPWVIRVEDTIAEGDQVVLRIIDSGTMVSDFMGMATKGKSFAIPAVQIARFLNGQLIEMWGFRDTAAIAQQMGLAPVSK